MRRAATLFAASTMVLAMAAAQPAASQDDLFRPPAAPSQDEEQPKQDKPTKPPAANKSLTGTWLVDFSGKSGCATNMEVVLQGDMTGVLYSHGNQGALTVVRSGSQVTIVNSYRLYGKDETELWKGTLSADGRTIAGDVSGAWGNGCKVLMRKQ
jgi:hypothetical protein